MVRFEIVALPLQLPHLHVFAPPKKISLARKFLDIFCGRFSEIHVEKLFDICTDSIPVEEGLTDVTV